MSKTEEAEQSEEQGAAKVGQVQVHVENQAGPQGANDPPQAHERLRYPPGPPSLPGRSQ